VRDGGGRAVDLFCGGDGEGRVRDASGRGAAARRAGTAITRVPVDGRSACVPGAGGAVPRAGAERGSGRARGGGGLGVELTVLGSSAAYPAAGGAASGYLLRHDGFNLWIDAGTGTL